MKALIFEEKVVQVSDSEFDVHDTLQWVDCDQSVQPGWSYINGKFIAPPAPTEQQLLDRCKKIASGKIAATDWSVLPDVNLQNKPEFEAYRATLRALIINPVADPVFPTEPQPVWS